MNKEPNILIENIKQHTENKHQLIRLAVADLKKTYNGSALGWAWAIIKPVFTIFVYWFALSVGLRGGKDVGDYPFLLWLISGMVAWFFMTEAITGGTMCIRRYSYLVTKMKFPVMTIPTFTNIASLFVHLLLVLVVIIIFACMGYPPTIYLLQLPLYTFLMFMFFNAWSLFAEMVSAIGKDFSNLVKSFNIGVFWLSGIIWNVESVADNKILHGILMLNPVTFISYGYRNCFIYHKWFFEEPKRLCYFLFFYVILAVASLWAYKKLYKEIPDVL